MKSFPRRELHASFTQKIADSDRPRVVLARIAGFTHSQALDTVLRSERVPATPLLVARLVRIAAAIGHPGDQIFADDTMAGAVATATEAAR
jgi:hypothetical protein